MSSDLLVPETRVLAIASHVRTEKNPSHPQIQPAPGLHTDDLHLLLRACIAGTIIGLT
jgi:hypothetical protein